MNEIPAGLPKHLVWDDTPTAKAPNNALGKDDFMRLLLTQMQNQDPLNPMDHKDFSAQLAQFGALEKLSNIETGIQGMQGGQRKEAGMQSMNLIGRRIEAQGQAIDLVPGQPAAFQPSIGEGMQAIKASLFNSQGQLVRTLDLSSLPAGAPAIWDGLNDQGQPAPPGRYGFRVLAKDAEGKAKEVGNDVSGVVTGLEMRGDSPLLVIDTGSGQSRVEASRVTSVKLETGVTPAGTKSLVAPAAVLKQPVVMANDDEDSDPVDEVDEPAAFPREIPWGQVMPGLREDSDS